ncbi:hypothetical protein [Halococcoides cellulosivorans]|uniref:hypothetical protein n=1 Tax=Halococcoides cellulosivorans TaxID=1679096 RepID=UPI00131F054B|nr:hypothetical protein [Halococcoides cellulosivorans]
MSPDDPRSVDSIMGVLQRGLGLLRTEDTDGENKPFVCTSCEHSLSVQYHTCPYCGSYDVRSAEWL